MYWVVSIPSSYHAATPSGKGPDRAMPGGIAGLPLKDGASASLNPPRHDGRQTGFVGVRSPTLPRTRLNSRTNGSPTCRRLAPDFALFPSGYRATGVPQVHPPPKTAKSAAAGRVSLSPRHVGGRALGEAATADVLTEVTARGEPRRNGPTGSRTKPRRKSASAYRLRSDGGRTGPRTS